MWICACSVLWMGRAVDLSACLLILLPSARTLCVSVWGDWGGVSSVVFPTLLIHCVHWMPPVDGLLPFSVLASDGGVPVTASLNDVIRRRSSRATCIGIGPGLGCVKRAINTTPILSWCGEHTVFPGGYAGQTCCSWQVQARHFLFAYAALHALWSTLYYSLFPLDGPEGLLNLT